MMQWPAPKVRLTVLLLMKALENDVLAFKQSRADFSNMSFDVAVIIQAIPIYMEYYHTP